VRRSFISNEVKELKESIATVATTVDARLGALSNDVESLTDMIASDDNVQHRRDGRSDDRAERVVRGRAGPEVGVGVAGERAAGRPQVEHGPLSWVQLQRATRPPSIEVRKVLKARRQAISTNLEVAALDAGGAPLVAEAVLALAVRWAEAAATCSTWARPQCVNKRGIVLVTAVDEGAFARTLRSYFAGGVLAFGEEEWARVGGGTWRAKVQSALVALRELKGAESDTVTTRVTRYRALHPRSSYTDMHVVALTSAALLTVQSAGLIHGSKQDDGQL
jgi:hypothetical protein